MYFNCTLLLERAVLVTMTVLPLFNVGGSVELLPPAYKVDVLQLVVLLWLVVVMVEPSLQRFMVFS